MAVWDEKIPGDTSGGIFGGLFDSPYMPALMVAFSSGLKATGLAKQGSALVEAAGRKQQAAEFESESDEVVLLKQPWIKDSSKDIRTLINETIGKTGENIQVKRFARFEIGE